MTSTSPSAVAAAPGLRRSLRLRDLVLYGIIAIQPVAPMSVFGVLSERGHGHVVTAVLIAMIAMLFTGISYGSMARLYPSAGSAFTYVGGEIHPTAGWLTGWGMLMDYVFNPLICTCWCAQQANVFFPGIPVWAWKVGFAVGFTVVNLRAIQSSARINAALAAGMGLVVVALFTAAAIWFASHPVTPSEMARPFYDPATFRLSALFHCTSLAVLTYIGFDGISTLSEEVENPRRNVMLAIVLTCVSIGLLSAIEVYVAQLVWPAREPFPNVDTAYVWVAARLWAPFLGILGLTLLVANVGSGMAAQLGAARLLYGMGRTNALPRSIFGAVHAGSHIPRNNVVIVGAVVLGGSFLFSFSMGAEMLNFGALIAFMGVNVASFLRHAIRGPEKSVFRSIAAVIGFLVCLGLWLSLSSAAKMYGSLWMVVGLLLVIARRAGNLRLDPAR